MDMPRTRSNRSVWIWTARTSSTDDPRRLLVVDDYMNAADGLAAYFNLYGFDARVAYGGDKAIETVTSWSPALSFVDISMPGVSGLVVAERLRAVSATADVVLIAYSAMSGRTDVERARIAGFDAFVEKPTDPSHLLEIVERFALVTP